MSILVAPLEALTDSRLSDPERRVLLALFSFRDKTTNTVWPSVESLAARSHLKDKTRVSKLTRSLSEKGWLTKKKRGFTGGNQYTLTMPAILDSAAKLEDESKKGGDASSNLDSDANSNLDSAAKNKEQTREQTKEQTNSLLVESEFDALWKTYPKRSGSNPKKPALDNYKKLREKHSAEEILMGVIRYAKYIRVTGKECTEYVKQAKTFLGPDMHWQDDFLLPTENTQQRPQIAANESSARTRDIPAHEIATDTNW